MALPYSKQFTITQREFGKLFEWSVDQFGGRPCGYARLLSLDADCDMFFQVEKDGPLIRSLEGLKMNEVFEINDPYVGVLLIPKNVPCRVQIYAVMEDLSRLEVSQIMRERTWVGVQGVVPNITRGA